MPSKVAVADLGRSAGYTLRPEGFGIAFCNTEEVMDELFGLLSLAARNESAGRPTSVTLKAVPEKRLDAQRKVSRLGKRGLWMVRGVQVFAGYLAVLSMPAIRARLHAMHCHAWRFRVTASRWVRLPQVRAALMSGDVSLGLAEPGVVGTNELVLVSRSSRSREVQPQ